MIVNKKKEIVQTVHQLGIKEDPIWVQITINKKPLTMELDTGASVSVLSEETFHNLWSKRYAPGLCRPYVKLRTSMY